MIDVLSGKQLRRQAEGRVLQKPPDLGSPAGEDLAKLVIELEVHQVELERQNEELEEARQKLEDERARFQALYDYAPVGYITLDKYNLVREANITFCQMLRVRRADLLKQRFTRFIVPEYQSAFYLNRRAVLESNTREICELALRRSDGETYHAEIESVPDEGGLRCTVSDITSRREAEAEIRVKDHAIASAVSGIFMADTAGRVIYANAAFVRMWGYDKPEEVIGKPLASFGNGSPAEAEKFLSVLKADGKWHGEFSARKKDGTVFDAEGLANVIDEPGNPHPKIMASFLDISERKRLERMKDEFLGLVSHELRTPLTIIEGSLKVALELGSYEGDLRDLIVNASRSADDLGAILENMLELTRYQSGRLHLHTESVNLRRVVDKVVKALDEYEAGRQFQIAIPDDLPNVQADPLRLERILHNLLGNAAKYSPADREIRVAAEAKEGIVVTRIIDQGAGISQTDQQLLFNSFRRLGDTAAVKGTGLGLVVCKRLLEAQGGWIDVASAPGRGSTFSFGLPVEQTGR